MPSNGKLGALGRLAKQRWKVVSAGAAVVIATLGSQSRARAAEAAASPSAAVAEAKSLLASGRQTRGLDLLNAALARDPADLEARLLRIEELHRRGLYPLGLADVAAGRAKAPSRPEWALWEARLRFAERDDSAGLDGLEKIPPGQVDGLLRMEAARAALRLERPEAARKWLDLAIESTPQTAEPHLERALLLADEGKSAAALAEVEPFLKNDGEGAGKRDGKALAVRASLHRRAGDFAAAAADVKAALAVMGLYWRAHLEQARLRRDQGDLEGALAAYQTAADLSSEDPTPRVERADVLLRLGRVDEARRDVEQAVQTTPRRPSVLYVQGRAELQAKRFGQAKKAFDALLVLNPQRADGYNGRGRVYQAWEAWTEALADFTRAIEIGPPSADWRLQRAETLRKLGRDAEARAEEARAAELAAAAEEKSTGK